jgi:1-acyl-sn-glycerol-3-phosphate acyltransferase
VILFLKFRFGYKYEKNPFKTNGNYIVLSNHTTDFDMLFVASSFKKPMYFVGSEHIARWKLLYAFLKVCFDPIMRNKGASAASAVKEIKRRIKSGANICFFPEGVRSWDGANSPISYSTAKLVKTSGAGLVTYKIIGGYFTSPMWSGASVRRGKVFGSPVRYLSVDEISSLSVEEIYDIIVNDLYEDAYERQNDEKVCYKGKCLAEGLERLIFKCPECEKRDRFVSSGNHIKCENCGYSFNYNEQGFLEGGRFKTLKELSDWQKTEVENDVIEGVEYTAETISFLSIKNHKETTLSGGKVVLSPKELKIGESFFPTDKISDLAMCGNRKIVFTHDKDYYEFVPDNNALKFMIYYNLIKQKERN